LPNHFVHSPLSSSFLCLPLFCFLSISHYLNVVSFRGLGGLCLGIYGCITSCRAFPRIAPILRLLSRPLGFVCSRNLYVIQINFSNSFTSRDHAGAIVRWYRARDTSWRLHWPSWHDMQNIEHSVNQLSSDIDYLPVMDVSTLKSLTFRAFFDSPSAIAPQDTWIPRAQFLKTDETNYLML